MAVLRHPRWAWWRSLAAAVGMLSAPAPILAQAATDPPAATVPGTEAADRLAAVCDPAPTTSSPAPPAPPPYGGPLCERPVLTGDWYGMRDTLRDHGITWDISSTNFYQGVASGGLQDTFKYGGRADYLLHVDGEKAGMWKGLFIDLHGETIYGESINGQTGALSPVALAQAVPIPNGSVTALTGVKFTQALSERFLVYGGKINVLDTFNQPFTGGARGTGGFANAGVLLPLVLGRTIPYSTFGAGAVVLKGVEPVFSVNVFDTNNTPTVSGFDSFFDNGASVLAQATLPYTVLERPGHLSVGGSYSSGRYTAISSLPYLIVQRLQGELPALPSVRGSWCVYGLFDQAVWVDTADPRRSWGLFGSLGITDGNPNPIRWSGAIGVGGASPFRNRKLDSFGVGYYYLGVSDALKGFAPKVFPLGDEYGVELFYNVGVTPWFHVTPDLQIVTPFREKVDTSVNVGVRAKIDF